MSQGPVANVVTTADNAVWYTDKVKIVTGSTPVTYQVYATALRDQTAQGNIYSDPASVDADSSQEIYVGVGNWLTVTGTDWTGTEIGGQTSAQAGVGGYGVNSVAPPPVPIPTTPNYTNIGPAGNGLGIFLDVSGESYPCLANVTTNWGINYSNGVSTGWVVVSRDNSFSGQALLSIGQTFPSGDYSFSNIVSNSSSFTAWFAPQGGTGTNMVQVSGVTGNVVGYGVYIATAPFTSVATVTAYSTDGSSSDITADAAVFNYTTGTRYRFAPL